LEQSSPSIDRVIVDAVLAGRIRAGMRLGEQALATLFQVSRTSVREALIRLETRGIVQVSPRRGWFVVEPSLEEAQEAFQARCAIEMGILRTVAAVKPGVIDALRDHIRQEREAIASNDVGARWYLVGTVLISALYQSTHDATESCDDHEHITAALAAGDLDRAASLMTAHIGSVEAGLTRRIDRDPLLDLRQALQLTPKNAGPNPPR
jgi:DNA-binding GntR family transcriptional regulator